MRAMRLPHSPPMVVWLVAEVLRYGGLGSEPPHVLGGVVAAFLTATDVIC